MRGTGCELWGKRVGHNQLRRGSFPAFHSGFMPYRARRHVFVVQSLIARDYRLKPGDLVHLPIHENI